MFFLPSLESNSFLFFLGFHEALVTVSCGAHNSLTFVEVVTSVAVFIVLQLNQLMSEITLGELTVFGEDSKLDTLLGN